MTKQVKVTTEEALNEAWKRIGTTDWDQMAWFVKLARVSNFVAMSTVEQTGWQEEFMAILLRGHAPLMKSPLVSNRYRRSGGSLASALEWPTPTEMQQVRDAVKRPIDDLADGRETWMPENGSFSISYSVKFMGNPEHFDKPDIEPRYLVFHNEVGGNSGQGSFQSIFVMRLLRLLEAYPDKNRHDICADKLRRCPHCKNVFLQVKRSSRYCGPKCYTVAGMKRLREERKSRPAVKKTNKRQAQKSRKRIGRQLGKAKKYGLRVGGKASSII